MLSGFFLKKKPPFNALKKSTCIPKMLWQVRELPSTPNAESEVAKVYPGLFKRAWREA
jgi:hypothetical protein